MNTVQPPELTTRVDVAELLEIPLWRLTWWVWALQKNRRYTEFEARVLYYRWPEVDAEIPAGAQVSLAERSQRRRLPSAQAVELRVHPLSKVTAT